MGMSPGRDDYAVAVECRPWLQSNPTLPLNSPFQCSEKESTKLADLHLTINPPPLEMESYKAVL